jgi:AcrR family transcriptional regulator
MTEDKAKILLYSRKKFYREGFYKITMDEISSELRVSKKTIYKHFPSKEILVREICNLSTSDVEKHINSILENSDNVVEKFVKLMIMYSNFIIHISENWLRDLRIHAPEVGKHIDETRSEKINKIFSKLLVQGKKEKLIENYPSPIIIALFTSTLRAIINPDFLIANKFSIKDAFWKSYEILMKGILTDRGNKIFNKAKIKLQKEIKFEIIT